MNRTLHFCSLLVVTLTLTFISPFIALGDQVILHSGAVFEGEVIQDDENRVVIKIEHGKLCFQHSEVKAVITEKTKLLAEGDECFANGKFGRAIPFYRLQIESFPEHKTAVSAYLRIGLAYRGMKRAKEAIAIFKSLPEKYPDSKLIPRAIYELARSYEKEDKFREASRNYSRVVEKYPTDKRVVGEATFRLGMIQYKEKDYANALSAFEEVTRNHRSLPTAADAWYQKGIILLEQGKREEAEKCFHNITSAYPRSPRVPDSLYRLAKIEFDQISSIRWDYSILKRYNPIIKKLGNFTKRYPRSTAVVRAKLLTARCYGKQAEYAKQAETFERYVKLVKTHSGQEQGAREVKTVADGYFKDKAYIQAGKLYMLIGDKFPIASVVDELDYKLNLSRCYEKNGYFQQALLGYKELARSGSEEMAEAAKEGINAIYARQGQGVVLAQRLLDEAREHYRKGEELDKAVEVCQQIIDKNPEGNHAGLARFLIAVTHLSEGKEKKALGELNDLVGRFPGGELGAKAQFLIAYSYMRDAEFEQAVVEYEKLIKKFPRSPYIEQGKRMAERAKAYAVGG